ncbi:MAG: TraB/GumN family protein [Rhodosalinus sp.]
MPGRIAAIFLWIGFATPLAAACAGEDLRRQLDAEVRAEIARAVAETPYAEGNRWRAARDGRVIDILGTLHLDDPRLDAVAEAFRPTVENADMLLVEMSPEDEAALTRSLAEDPGQLLLSGAQTLPGLMDERDWNRVASEMRKRGIPPTMGARMQPWYLSLQLAIPACAAETLAAGGRGLDHRVTAIAADAGVPVRSLEDPQTLFALFSDEPPERQVRLMLASLLPQGRGEDMFATLVESYFDEAHAAGWEVSRHLAIESVDLPEAEVKALYDDLHDEMLVARNKAWIDIIEAAPGDRLAMAFGAAHLFGREGVLALLEREGYALSRQAF